MIYAKLRRNHLNNNTLGEIKSIKNLELEPTDLQKEKLATQTEKKNLIDRFFNLGGNQDLEKLLQLENDLEKFNSKNNDKDIARLIIILEMYKINTRTSEVFDLSFEFCDLFMEISKKEDLTLFEIRLLLMMFTATNEPKELFEVTKHLLNNVDNYMLEPDYIRLKFFIYQNVADTLMHLRRNNINYNKDEYDEILIGYLLNAIALTKQYDNKYWNAVVRLNLGIVLQDDFTIKSNIAELKLLNDAVIDENIRFMLSEYNIEY